MDSHEWSRRRDNGHLHRPPFGPGVRYASVTSLALCGLACADVLGIPNRPHLVEDTPPGGQLPVAAGARPILDPLAGSGPSTAPPAARDGTLLTPPRDEGVPASDNDGPEQERGDGGLGDDAGSVTRGTANDAGLGCEGADLFGVCWYLGALGASCVQACQNHGGLSDEAALHVGTPAQGGSLGDCGVILVALGEVAPPDEATRSDGRGLGCHVFGLTRAPFWLSSPSFDPSDAFAAARIACGCRR